MKKIFLTLIVFAFPFAHIVFAQNKQTIVVRPETAREKEERKMKDAVESFKMLGEMFGSSKDAKANCLNEVKNSKYSVFVEKKLANWKKKGEFEKTADWQKRLQDSTAIKKAEIQESAIDEYAKALDILKIYGYDGGTYELNYWFYDSRGGQYDADKEVLLIKTFWGNIPIPIPLDEAKNMQGDIQFLHGRLEPRFFIQNDQLALLSLTYKTYTYKNPSKSAQKILEQKKAMVMELKKAMADISVADVKALDDRGVDIADLQDNKVVATVKEAIFDHVEVMPQFPGGEKAMMAFLSQNLKYPIIALEQGIQGTVLLRLVIGKTGEITDVTVMRSLDPSCDKEAVRVVKTMPKWTPGKHNGNPVNVYFNLPVRFRLQN